MWSDRTTTASGLAVSLSFPVVQPNQLVALIGELGRNKAFPASSLPSLTAREKAPRLRAICGLEALDRLFRLARDAPYGTIKLGSVIAETKGNGPRMGRCLSRCPALASTPGAGFVIAFFSNSIYMCSLFGANLRPECAPSALSCLNRRHMPGGGHRFVDVAITSRINRIEENGDYRDGMTSARKASWIAMLAEEIKKRLFSKLQALAGVM